MSRIVTNVQSLIAQRVLGQQNKTLSTSLERLSTGFRINRGADDPAGLIASENLRAEKTAISAAIGNAERADQVVNIAEGGLQEINAMLIELQGLVGRSANEAGMGLAEREANQLQIDSILQTIDRISTSTSFEGVKLLNGTFDFTISAQNTKVSDYQIHAAKLDHGGFRTINTLVTHSAQHGGLIMSAGGVNSLDLTDANAKFIFELAGARGARQFTFASGATLDTIRDQINTYTEVTGVSAIVSNTAIVLKSDEYGSSQFVSVKVREDGGQAGGFYGLSEFDENAADTTLLRSYANAEATEPIADFGKDVGAIINGISATAVGKSATINTDYLHLTMEFSDAGATSLSEFTGMHITGGGAKFNVGPRVNITNQVSIGIKHVAARNLGTRQIGYLSQLGEGEAANVVNGDLAKGQKIVDEAINQISKLRGSLGAFQKNVLGSTIRSLGVALENTSAAESMIRETDFANETATMTRQQILVQAATNSLALANSRPQSVLQLLGG